ncbi:MAG: lactonase family protein [Planctomyces sp.]|nr:lactonase family protein [Planctomyces sp.]
MHRRRLLFLALWSVLVSLPATLPAADADGIHVYFGTYTRGSDSRGIYHARLNLETGAVSEPQLVAEVDNPSFLAIHPFGQALYAVAEIGDFEGEPAGGAAAFALDRETGQLTALNVQSSKGGAPCHCVVDPTGKSLLIANYTGGSVVCLPIEQDGSLKPASAFVQHEGHSVNAQRQEAPHAHSINIDPANRFAVAADLGLDKLLVYRFDADRGTLTPNDPPGTSVAPGAGPRHFAFHSSGDYAYVINELDLTVTAFRYAPQHGVLYGFQTVSTVPDGVDYAGGNSTAEVQVHPSGKFLYGSNRGHHSIAMFQIDPGTGRLTSLGQEPTGGQTPRNFGIDPTGKYLLAANQDSDTVVVFEIDAESGRLKPTGVQVAVPRPVCVKFLR